MIAEACIEHTGIPLHFTDGARPLDVPVPLLGTRPPPEVEPW